MNRRALVGAIAATPILSGCARDQHFDLSWEEEVETQDGRSIVVHVKHTYESIGRGIFTTIEQVFSPYAGKTISRDTTLTLDTGGKAGTVTQLFKGFHPMFLGQHDGEWYSVLYGDYYNNSRQTRGQDWGALEGPYGQWAIRLDQGKWKPISMSRLPSEFQRPNMLMLYGDAHEHAEFNGKRVTLRDKKKWLEKHPLGYAHIRLTRPTAASPRRPDSIANIAKGESA